MKTFRKSKVLFLACMVVLMFGFTNTASATTYYTITEEYAGTTSPVLTTGNSFYFNFDLRNSGPVPPSNTNSTLTLGPDAADPATNYLVSGGGYTSTFTFDWKKGIGSPSVNVTYQAGANSDVWTTASPGPSGYFTHPFSLTELAWLAANNGKATITILNNGGTTPGSFQISDARMTGVGAVGAGPPVPIPPTVLLLGTGLIGLVAVRRPFKKLHLTNI